MRPPVKSWMAKEKLPLNNSKESSEKTMKVKLILVALAGAAISGCTTTPAHQCQLVNQKGQCASMEDSYKAAMSKSGKRVDLKQESVFDSSSKQIAVKEAAEPIFTGQATLYPEPGQQGTPVFKQPRVHRVWIPPYVDADGNLRSGEYAYFSTPGQWNYGTMKKPGSAAASTMFGPSRGDNYGVNIQNTNKNIVGGTNAAVPTAPSPNGQNGAPPAPAAVGSQIQGQPPRGNSQTGQIQSVDPTAIPVDGITQPVQRFN